MPFNNQSIVALLKVRAHEQMSTPTSQHIWVFFKHLSQCKGGSLTLLWPCHLHKKPYLNAKKKKKNYGNSNIFTMQKK
jgi:hypothetical protein